MRQKISSSLVVAGVLLAVVALTPAGPAGGAPSARDICGTIEGSDGRYVNATIGIVLTTSSGAVLDLNGGGGYSLDNVSVNSGIPPTGIVPGSPEDTGDLEDTFCFEDIDTAAANYLFEVYPRAPGQVTDTSRYGGASRSATPIPVTGLNNANVRLPLQCDEGGETGSLQVQAYSNGSPTTIGRVLVVSENNPPNGIQGFAVVGAGAGGPNGPVAPLTIDGLAPNQRYSVQVTFANRQRKSYFIEVPIRPCETTTIRAWTGATPAGTPNRWSSKPQAVSGSYFPVPGDFTGDGLDDIFWYAAGAPMDYLWEGVGVGSGFISRPFPVNGTYRPTSGDYDGDGVDDLYFYGPGGAADYKWYFDEGGLTYTSVPDPAGLYSTTSVRSGDFDGNGQDDILFYSPGGTDSVWVHTTGGNGAHTSRPIAISGSSNVTVGDINGDFRADVFQQVTTTGTVNLFYGNSTGGFTTRVDGTGRTYRPIMGDFSCDFRADVIMYQPGTAIDSMWRGRSSLSPYFSKESAALGINGSYLFPFTGDFDGNGCADVFWYQPGAGADSMWLNSVVGWHKPYQTVSGSF